MNNTPKQLGLNVSIFENFVKKNRIYIDKTKIIYDLITAQDNEHFYFVSRPRRFGKSLFISTLKEIFSGRRELFDEYWIGKHSNYDWPRYHIIHLDFGGIAHGTAEDLKQSLYNSLKELAREHNITLAYTTIEDALKFIVKELSKQHQVVLLIDEYDKPLVDHVDNLPLAEENRKILSSFYTTVKSLEAHWRAIFITGVSKFARTSLFSGLNNLKELTFDPIAAELFGYTYEELITYLLPRIDDLAKHLGKTREETLANMKLWYNGYRFSKDMQKSQMYNPLSVIACLNDKEFSNIWFNTGSPGFLIPLLRLKGTSLEIPDVIKATIGSFNAFDIKNIPVVALLLQTGYLTIVDYDASTEVFTLDYPNREVRESFKNYLMLAFAYTTPEVLEMALIRMRRALERKDFEEFCRAIKSLFAGIPYHLHIATEPYYHSLFHFMFDMLSMRPQSEVATSHGRADLVLETAHDIFIFEFKYDKSAQEAFDQIIRKKYYEKYMYMGKPITLVGIDMNIKDKELELEWVQQSL